jgi:hypothetical protein
MHDLAIFEDHTYSQFVRKPRYKLEVIIKAKPITFPLYWIAFCSGAKSTYPIRNVQLSEAEGNNISPLQ